MMKIGPYQLTSIESGQFALDGGAMFGVVPKPLWEKSNPADDANRIEMNLRCLLIQKAKDQSGPARNILIDCGMGLKWADKYIQMYKIDHARWSLVSELGKVGLKMEDITDVILTHLHFDHAGGLTVRDDPSDPHSPVRPAFPNAKVWIQRQNWDLAWSPSEKDQASYLTENYLPYRDDSHYKSKIEFIETRATDPSGRTAFTGPDSDETTLLPGISVEVSHGHTLGMQLVRVSDGSGKPGGSLIYCADLIPTASHVRIPYIMGYDCYPMFILAEKKRLLERCVQENTAIFYEHCPTHAATMVIKDPKRGFLPGTPIQL